MQLHSLAQRQSRLLRPFRRRFVPELRKAQAVKLCLEGEIRPSAPASILREHPNATIYLDRNSSSLLTPALRKECQLIV